jgi:signal transduction histidine kinase
VTSPPIRVRVAGATALVALAVLVGMGVVVYRQLEQTLTQQALLQARGDALRLVRLVDSGSGEQQGTAVSMSDPELVTRLSGPGASTLVVDPRGGVVQASQQSQRAVASIIVSDCLRQGSVATVIGGRAFSCARMGQATAPRGAIVSGVSLASRDSTLAAMRRVIVIAIACAFAVVLAAGWLATRRALRPLARIARTAQEIGGGELGRRTGYTGPRDEVGVLAQALDESFDRLEGSIGEQRRFLADVSHELRTPLASSGANLALLTRWAGTEPSAREQALQGLTRSISRMSRLVDDLLHVAHGLRGPGYARADVSLEDVLVELQQEAHTLEPDAHVALHVTDSPLVTGDRDKLYQLLRNILDNALRHAPAGSAVDIELRGTASSAQIRISDRGPGIPANELDQIFDRRFQGTSSGGGGAGLGLAIAKEVAAAHGGTIIVESAPGRGTAMTVVLPRAVALYSAR